MIAIPVWLFWLLIVGNVGGAFIYAGLWLTFRGGYGW